MKNIYILSLFLFLFTWGCKKDKTDEGTIVPDPSDTLWKYVSDANWPSHALDFRLICSPEDSVYYMGVSDENVALTALDKSHFYGLKGCCQYTAYAADFSPGGQFYFCLSLSLISTNGVEMYNQINANRLSEGLNVLAFYGVNNFNSSHADKYLHRLAGYRNCIAFESDGLPVVFSSYFYNQTDSFKKVRLSALKFTGLNKWESKGVIDANTNNQVVPANTFFISDKKNNKIAAVYTKVNDENTTSQIVVKENTHDSTWTQLGQVLQTAASNTVIGGYATDGKPVIIYGDKGTPGTVIRIRHWNGSSWDNWGDQKFDSDLGGKLSAALVDSKNQVWFAIDYYETGDPYHTKIAILRRNSNGQWLNVSRGMEVSQNATYSINGFLETGKAEIFISEAISTPATSQLFIYKWSSKKW